MEYRALLSYAPNGRRFPSNRGVNAASPAVLTTQGVVLRSDIVGFTRLTDQMVETGIGGAEKLADFMNRVVNRMAELASFQGGELASLAGDAASFVWLERPNLSLDDATVLAIQAALAIHREAETWVVGGEPLRFRSAVGCGLLHHFEIGGRDGEWHGVLTGPALADVLAADSHAAPGHIVSSAAAAVRAARGCDMAPVGNGMARVRGVLRRVTPPGRSLIESAPWRLAQDTSASRPHEPGEFRTVTAVYTHLQHREEGAPEQALAALQDAALRIQACLARFEGQIYQICGDEDGVTFIAVFGLRPWSHEDDAARAVGAALSLYAEWGKLGLTSSTGIATGRIFCGVIRTQTDWGMPALIGPIMNLAARLMQLRAGVVCDATTKQAGRQSQRIFARKLTPKVLKGKRHPITAFVPYTIGEEAQPVPRAVIGRAGELEILSDALARVRQGDSVVAVVEGEAGMGKTTLANFVLERAGSESVVTLAGAANSSDQVTPYLAWRRILRDLLERSDLTVGAPATRSPLPSESTEPASGAPRKIPVSLDAFRDLTPLLQEMLGIEFADNDHTRLLQGRARADALVRTLIDILRAAAQSAPLLVFVDDLHWLDPTSLAFFARLSEERLPLMLVGATRPADSEVWGALEGIARLEWLRLVPMTAEETGQLLARTLGAGESDVSLSALFRDRTGGNPLFVQELSRIAFDNQLVVVRDDVRAAGSVAATNRHLEDLLRREGVPSTIEAVIRGRLDTLEGIDLTVLRCASVAGAIFTADLCRAGAPVLEPGEIDRALVTLTELDLIAPLASSVREEFAFRHAILRDVTYNAMSFAERQRLHGHIGAWIEAHPGPEDVSAILGEHFAQAGEIDKATRYLTAAGETAVHRYANAEAAVILTRALDLARGLGGPARGDNLRDPSAARISLLLGRALLGTSSYEGCRVANEEGLKLAGFQVAQTSVGVSLRVLTQTAEQVWRAFRSKVPEVDAAERQRLRDAVLAFESLAETYFYLGDGVRTLYAAMAGVNISERLGPSGELARGCATLSGIAGLFRMDLIRDRYAARALAALDGVDEDTAKVWVFLLLGNSKLGTGDWDQSKAFFARVAQTAERLGDRRRWRDGVENEAIVEACRGRWRIALDGFSAMFDSARQDKDQRYMVLAHRERAYCHHQLGDLPAVDNSLRAIRNELQRPLSAEELATRQDFHAIAASAALQRGDYASAARESDAALRAIQKIGGTSSFPNMYLTVFLVARVFANLSRLAPDPAFQRGMAAACRALSRQAWSHPIAAPSAAIALGYLAQSRGKSAKALREWRRAADVADDLGMAYERRLAQFALGSKAPPAADDAGLPFLVADDSYGASG